MKESLTKKIFKEKTIEKMQVKAKLLGPYNNRDINNFLMVRLLLSILIFLVLLFGFDLGYIFAPVFTVLYYIGSEILIFDIPIKKRSRKLEKEALFFFEVFALTLEGGRTLKHAIDLTSQNIDSEISEEFKRALAEVRLGKSLNESLEGMKKRIPSESINNTLLNIIQSNTYGTNILDSIYNQIDYLRDKQILNVKAEIAKLPTKVSVISVIFFVPIMLLIILAPVLISYISK